MAGATGSVTRAIGANIGADLQELFGAVKRMPLFGVSKGGERAMAHDIAAIRRVGADSTRRAQNLVNEGTEKISGILDDAAKAFGRDDVTAETIGREINSAYGHKDTGKVNDALNDISGKYNISADNMNTITGTMSLSNRLAKRYTDAATAPLSLAKDYMLDGSPLATYAKGAAIVTGAQFLNGSRTSLTTQNGQRDIAGVPFI
jgi:hypothetical protein